ncbi:MAG: sigma-70 family RNA polymerase sigma factor [Candidatus Omnitrophota bacterium]
MKYEIFIDFLIKKQYNVDVMETRDLLLKCAKKDRKAWDEFFRQYESLVTRTVRYKLKKLNFRASKEEYRDIVQEIFISIWEKDKLSKVKNAAALKGWLAIVSLNFTANYCSRKAFKSAKNTFSLNTKLSQEDTGFTLESIVPAEKFNTEKMVESNEIRELVNSEISKLGPKQQLALKLNILDGRTQKDISSIMAVPEGTVATLISRAKKQVKANLQKIMEPGIYG